MKRIAIVGGGFSGTVVLAQLVEKAAAGTVIDFYEASGLFGPGLAYASTDNSHLLNVPAGRMGAFEPNHFLLWLQSAEGAAACARFWPEAKPTANDFLPRSLYGRYLEATLTTALLRADARGVTVSLIADHVLYGQQRSTAPRIGIRTRGHRRAAYDALVLATGNHPPCVPKAASWWAKVLGLVANPWSVLQQETGAAQLCGKDTVLLLGSGLTAVDAVLSLERRGFTGRIIALSRHGLLPRSHISPASAEWSWRVPPADVAPTAVAVFRWLKNETRAAGQAWRAVFDALRPITPQLWARLPSREQLRLLHRHALWSVHRHRMAPAIADRMAQAIASGRFDVITGKLISLSSGLGRPYVRFRRRGARKEEVMRPALVLNCTGSDYHLHANRLLASMVKHAMVRPSPNCLGLEADQDGAVGERVFAIGAPLFGSLFETTAVPELRIQARRIAERLAELSGVNPPPRPG